MAKGKTPIFFKTERGIEKGNTIHEYKNLIHVRTMDYFETFIKRDQIINVGQDSVFNKSLRYKTPEKLAEAEGQTKA